MAKNKIAVVYARYSSHRQGEQSIEGQLAEAYKYAAANGLTIVKEYIDRAMTGKNDNRDQFQLMLKDTAKKQFDTIILWKIDRFGRNREEIAFNKYRCKKNGIKVVYVAESIPDSPEGVILESVLEGMAEYYSLQLAQNILRGQRESAKKCQSTGGNRPLGYLTDPQTKKFVIDPQTAPTVKLIFEMYAKGYSATEIITTLNSKGLRTLRGGEFTKNSLHTILKNEKYIGIYTYKDEVRVEGGVPRIIDDETFAKVQEMLKVNKRAPARVWQYSDYMLTGKLFCGHCGSQMIGESGKSKTGAKHNYYVCVKKRRERTCHKKAVRQDWIESIVLDAVVAILDDNEMLDFIANSVYEYYQEQNTDEDAIKALKRELANVENSTRNIIKAIEAGIFNEATKQRLDELELQKHNIEAEIAAVELSKNWILTKDHILFFLYELRKKDLCDRDSQRQLIDTFVNTVFLYDNGKTVITFNYSGDNRAITINDLDCIEAGGAEFVCRALCSTIDIHVIGEFIRIPHLGKIYCSSGGSVCFGQDIHKIIKFS